MMPHDFMTLHSAKMVEYLIAVAYLLLFIPFWRFVNAGAEQAPGPARVPLRATAIGEWFVVPADLFYHPGHAWLRVDGRDTVTVGLDDFAGKLVGALSAIDLPPVGAALAQGERGWSLVAGDRTIDMLSPVDGTVVAVNEAVRHAPALAHDRPYDGWLLKVQSAHLAASLKQLLTGRLAKRWTEDLANGLRGGLMPALGSVSQDGGVVIDGLARALEPDNWEAVARRFLLTDDGGDDREPGAGTEGGPHA